MLYIFVLIWIAYIMVTWRRGVRSLFGARCDGRRMKEWGTFDAGHPNPLPPPLSMCLNPLSSSRASFVKKATAIRMFMSFIAHQEQQTCHLYKRFCAIQNKLASL